MPAIRIACSQPKRGRGVKSQHQMAIVSAKRPQRQRPEEKERYYLLPGQGGSSYRRKQRYIIKASIMVGLFVSAIFAVVMYFVYRVPR